MQDFLSDCESVDEAVQCLFNLSPSIKKSINLNNNNYLPYAITKSNTYPACTIATHLCVRLGDLAISPCHRTGYEKNIYGYFQVENNRIVGIKANNPYMAMRILFGNNTICSPKCDTCDFNKFAYKVALARKWNIIRILLCQSPKYALSLKVNILIL